MSEEGRAAIITNLRGYNDHRPDRASRGALVTDLLSGCGPYADPQEAALDDFNPFNLVLIDRHQAHFLTNRPHPVHTHLTPGVYGLSNGALDAPWPKTLALKTALLDWLVAGAERPETLLAALHAEHLPDAGLTPDTPSDIPEEAAMSPVFIRNPVYGTRCSTVVAIDSSGRATITERRFDAQGKASGATALDFSWPPE